MDSVLKKYPVPFSSQKYMFTHPVFTIDLHGFSVQESQQKLDWLKKYMQERKYETFRIITGIGGLKLHSLVTKTCKKWKQSQEIYDWKEKESDKHNEKDETICKKTGVFLIIA